MAGFERAGSGRRGFKKPGKRNFGGFARDSGRFGGKPRPQAMNEVTCDKCGERCVVPFKPTGDKPVYCSKCFRNNKDSASTSNINPYAGEFEKINRKLDRIMDAMSIK
jgi:CxxC-x17-CxxC domain-containing protein